MASDAFCQSTSPEVLKRTYPVMPIEKMNLKMSLREMRKRSDYFSLLFLSGKITFGLKFFASSKFWTLFVGTNLFISSSLPVPTKVLLLGISSLWTKLRTVSAPAVNVADDQPLRALPNNYSAPVVTASVAPLAVGLSNVAASSNNMMLLALTSVLLLGTSGLILRRQEQ